MLSAVFCCGHDCGHMSMSDDGLAVRTLFVASWILVGMLTVRQGYTKKRSVDLSHGTEKKRSGHGYFVHGKEKRAEVESEEKRAEAEPVKREVRNPARQVGRALTLPVLNSPKPRTAGDQRMPISWAIRPNAPRPLILIALSRRAVLWTLPWALASKLGSRRS